MRGVPGESRKRVDNTGTGRVEVPMGGSLPGGATFCQELVVEEALAPARRLSHTGLYCDPRQFAQGVLRSCKSFGARSKFLDLEARAKDLDIPMLIFAGTFDPIVRWHATERTARRMKDASFVLIEGPHSPIKEGGACFAAAIESFALGQTLEDRRCPSEAGPARSVVSSASKPRPPPR